jgi:hypothetical protein
MKKSMATAQMKSTRIALLVLLALAAMSVDRAPRLHAHLRNGSRLLCVCARLLLGFPDMVYPSRVHLHIYRQAAEHHFHTRGETTGRNMHYFLEPGRSTAKPMPAGRR